MSFTYTTGIPNPPDPPAGDVADMQVNTNSISSWTEVDHIGFNLTTAGQHRVMTFPTVQTTSTAPFAATYPISQIFPKSFGNVATTEELYYADSSTGGGPRASIQRLIPTCKAYAMVNWNGTVWTLLGASTNNLQVNIGSISATSNSAFTVNFTTNLDYASYSVFVTTQGTTTTVPTISSVAVGSFRFTTSSGLGVGVSLTVTLMVI